jgi:hypothetical protein
MIDSLAPATERNQEVFCVRRSDGPALPRFADAPKSEFQFLVWKSRDGLIFRSWSTNFLNGFCEISVKSWTVRSMASDLLPASNTTLFDTFLEDSKKNICRYFSPVTKG